VVILEELICAAEVVEMVVDSDETAETEALEELTIDPRSC